MDLFWKRYLLYVSIGVIVLLGYKFIAIDSVGVGESSDIVGLGDVFMIILAIVTLFISINKYGSGKGMVIGSLVSLTYIWVVDLLFLKGLIFKGCTDWCGIENLLFSFLFIGTLAIGSLLWLISYLKQRK